MFEWAIILFFFFLSFILIIKLNRRNNTKKEEIKFNEEVTNERLPYECKKYLLSKAERSFIGILYEAVKDYYLIAPKVRIADVLSVEKTLSKSEFQIAFNKISRKHFDFILINPVDYSIYGAIELDDKSHESDTATIRDGFVGKACFDANLKLYRFKAKHSYSITEVKNEIFGCSNIDPFKLNPENKEIGPKCEKCGSTMIKKISNKLEYKGQEFWACPEYPRCKSIMPIEQNATPQDSVM